MQRLVDEAGLQADFELDSAGLIDYHEGELPDARMRRHALQHGYRLTHRSRPVRQADFEHFDLIIGMDERNCSKLRRMAPHAAAAAKVQPMASYLTQHAGHSEIPDPYYGGDEGFELVIALLEDACAGLLDQL